MIIKKQSEKISKALNKSNNNYDYNQVVETETVHTEASNKIDPFIKHSGYLPNNLTTKNKIEIIDDPKLIKKEKEISFLKDNSDSMFQKPDFDEIFNKNEENEENIENIIKKYNIDYYNKDQKINSYQQVDQKEKKIQQVHSKKTTQSRHITPNFKQVSPNKSQKNEFSTIKSTGNKIMISTQNKNDYSKINKNKFPNDTNTYEDSISNYYESKNFKLDLNDLKLNNQKDDRQKNSFIDPITQRECSFIQTSDINNSNFLDDDHENKENEVVVCISNLDVKMDESNFNANFKNLNNKNANQNFLQSLNKNYPRNNGEYMKGKNTVSISDKFEEIKLNVNRIKSQRSLQGNVNNDSLNIIENTEGNKVEKIEDKIIQNDCSISGEKNGKNNDIEYLETENNLKVYHPNKRKIILIILIIILIFSIVSVYFIFFNK